MRIHRSRQHAPKRREVGDDGAVDPVRALDTCHGAARRDALFARGVTARALRNAVTSGKVILPVRGTYALPAAPADVVAAAALRGQVTCLSACERWGIPCLAHPKVPHIAVPADRHILDPRLDALRLPGVHRLTHCDLSTPIASAFDAIDAAAFCTSPLGQLVLIEGALDRNLMVLADLNRLTVGDARRLRWLRSNARLGAQSVSETVARMALVAGGMKPTIQVQRMRVGRVDMTVGTRHVVEIDGFAFHSSREAFREDRRRDREIAADGDWSLRFTYADVTEDPRKFVSEVARITGFRIHTRFDARMRWMLARPADHLNRERVLTIRRPGT